MTTRQQQLVYRAQTLLAAWYGPYVAGAIYRNPVESSGQVGAATVVSSSVSGWRRPATQDPRMMKLMPMALQNSARITHVLKVAASTDIRVGDRWVESGISYAVEGVAAFHTATLCALMEIKVQT